MTISLTRPHTSNLTPHNSTIQAGDEYKIKMESADGQEHYGAIIQLDGIPG